MKYALDSNWAVSSVKTSKVEADITIIGEVEPGIYEVEVQVLCTVAFKAGNSSRERGCGRTTRYLINAETGEVVQ